MDSASGSRPVRGRGVRRLAVAARARFDGLRFVRLGSIGRSPVVVARYPGTTTTAMASANGENGVRVSLVGCALAREGVNRRANE